MENDLLKDLEKTLKLLELSKEEILIDENFVDELLIDEEL